MEETPQGTVPEPKNLGAWLINPFDFITGLKALVLGLLAIAAAGLLASLSNSHFDGVLDFHTGSHVSLSIALGEGLVNWFSAAFVLLPAAAFLTKGNVKPLDLIGGQALARWPTIFTALVALPSGYGRYAAHVAGKYVKGLPEVDALPGDAVIFWVAASLVLVFTIYTVALMYRAFATACRTGGMKAVITFIIGILLAEAISKAIILKSILRG